MQQFITETHLKLYFRASTGSLVHWVHARKVYEKLFVLARCWHASGSTPEPIALARVCRLDQSLVLTEVSLQPFLKAAGRHSLVAAASTL